MCLSPGLLDSCTLGLLNSWIPWLLDSRTFGLLDSSWLDLSAWMAANPGQPVTGASQCDNASQRRVTPTVDFSQTNVQGINMLLTQVTDGYGCFVIWGKMHVRQGIVLLSMLPTISSVTSSSMLLPRCYKCDCHYKCQCTVSLFTVLAHVLLR